jgi:hypothetical protein
MPTKIPFDPSKHVIGPTQLPPVIPEPVVDDEAIARMLQEQILEEERQASEGASGYQDSYQNTYPDIYRKQSSGGSSGGGGGGGRYGGDGGSYRGGQQGGASNQQEMDDMQLLVLMQRQEMEAMQQAHLRQQQASQSRNASHSNDMEIARRMQQAEITDQVDNGYQDQLDYARRTQQRMQQAEADQVDSGYRDQLDYARRVQQQAFAKVDRQQRGSQEMSQHSSASDTHDSDLELARKMQQLEQMGMGSLNSTRDIMASPPSTSRDRNVLTNSLDSVRSRQDMENEDARLARMLAESDDPDPPHRSTPPPFRSTTPPRRTISPRPTTAAVVVPPAPAPLATSPHGSSRSPQPPKQVLAQEPGMSMDQIGLNVVEADREKAKKRGFFSRGQKAPKAPVGPPQGIPAPIPPPPQRRPGPLPFSSLASERLNVPIAPDAQLQKKKMISLGKKKEIIICSSCDKPASSFLIALEKKYHAECFKCVGCHLTIDSSGPFAYMTDGVGAKHPLHRRCYAELYGVKCAICKQSIPAGPDGKVSFVKHPFFETEQMCPRHAANPGRRCTGCHRFEPEGEPFADLSDSGRCVCYSCCRSVVVDSTDASPLWKKVIEFLEKKLQLPIWQDMREVPILIVGYDALNDQVMASGGNHGGSTQIMTRGLCLTEHQSGRRLKLQALKFNKNNFSFDNCDAEEKGFTYFQIPDASKVNPDASVTAILCLSGLPTDLAASVLAHEATHAWIKLHPRFDIGYPIPPQVEEGCAQLIAMLFLNEGLEAASTETYGDAGPSDAKLRQYFKFSIETDDHEVYGEGYRRAAKAYADIGIAALLSHVVLYKAFPRT